MVVGLQLYVLVVVDKHTETEMANVMPEVVGKSMGLDPSAWPCYAWGNPSISYMHCWWTSIDFDMLSMCTVHQIFPKWLFGEALEVMVVQLGLGLGNWRPSLQVYLSESHSPFFSSYCSDLNRQEVSFVAATPLFLETQPQLEHIVKWWSYERTMQWCYCWCSIWFVKK